jgi:hypothetical protein
LFASLAFATQASAQQAPATTDSDDDLAPSMGIDPTAPQAAALPGGMTPAFGHGGADKEWRFDFHGFITAPLNMGINKRQPPLDNPTAPAVRPGQAKTVLHAPPVVPDDFETFSHTGITPTTYVQLNLSDGNSLVTGNVSILARQANVSESFLEPASQLGISDAYLSITPDLGDKTRLRILVGAFTSRYGSTGEYDEGRYGTPLIARINGAGELTSMRSKFGDMSLLLEQGFQGQTNRAGSNITPDLWNTFADPGEGTTFVHHLHAGVAYKSALTLGGHFITAWSQDDHDSGSAPDGTINVLATDLGLNLGRFGHLAAVVSRTTAEHARTVSRIFSVLNTPGGPGLMNDYLGPESETDTSGKAADGTGHLTTIGGQYDLSLGRLASYPVAFTPDGPDFLLSLFGMGVHVQSKVKRFDDVTKVKYGAEGTYSLLSWLAVSARVDHVAPKRTTGIPPANRDPLKDSSDYSFSVLSPRVIFRTGWTSTDQVVLQYSHWIYGDLASARHNDPPSEDFHIVPDKDVVSLSASMWW